MSLGSPSRSADPVQRPQSGALVRNSATAENAEVHANILLPTLEPPRQRSCVAPRSWCSCVWCGLLSIGGGHALQTGAFGTNSRNNLCPKCIPFIELQRKKRHRN